MTQEHSENPSSIFQDPAVLLAWLESHAFLPIGEQVAVATRALEVEQSQVCRDVLEAYILGLTDSKEQESEEISRFKRIGLEDDVQEPLAEIDEAELPLSQRVWRTLLNRYPKVLVLALILALYNVGYGIYVVLGWITR